MSIKSHGGVFGRNPTFNNVDIEGNLSVDGTFTVGGSVLTGLNLQGNWNASTNSPDLTVLTPAAGQFWVVSADGSTNLGGITNWTSGDWAFYDGSSWHRIEGGTVDLSNAVTGKLPIANGGTNATDAATARANLGLAIGTDVEAADSTILKNADIGVTVQGYDANILTSSDIGSTVQGYDADTAKYDDATANFTGTLQNGGSNVVVDSDIGSTVQAYDANILTSSDIGSTVQGYDADTAKYDDTTANFTGTLQENGNNVVTANEIGTIASQAYTNVNIDGGNIDGTAIGANTPSTGKFTTGSYIGTVDNEIFRFGTGTNFQGMRCRVDSSYASGRNLIWYTLNVPGSGVTSIYTRFESFSNGTSTVNHNVVVDGSLSKGSGSFKIDHPLMPDTHYLAHSFIEGPQADNIYRGRVTLQNGSATVNIDVASDMTAGTFAALNRDVQCFTSNESGWTAVRGSVSGGILTIEAEDSACSDTISWMVIGERKDKHMYETDWTDDNGKVIVEPPKILELAE
jgi:hypothetical protein